MRFCSLRHIRRWLTVAGSRMVQSGKGTPPVSNETAMTGAAVRQYRLGPLPWSQETLKTAYWRNFIEAYALIKEHPGFGAHEMMEDVQRSLEIFLDHTDSLLAAIRTFKEESGESDFFSRSNKNRIEALERRVRKYLFAVSSAASH
jgi:hypothetical protein